MLFLVLDVDNTLLSTLTLGATEFNRRTEILERLKVLYPGTGLIQYKDEAAVIPRPGLAEFISFLDTHEDQIRVGIYSSAHPEYLRLALNNVAPLLLAKSEFLWGVDQCVDIGFKSLEKVSKLYDQPLKHIFAIDDLAVITPEENRIKIAPFEVSTLTEAKDDFELARVVKHIRYLLDAL